MSRSRKDTTVRRDEILRATVRHIEQAGIHAVRMADVAADLSVSTSLVLYHFKNKEALIAEAFTWAAQRDLEKLAQLIEGVATASERLRTALEWYAPTGQAKGWRLWIEGWSAALREPELRQVGRELDLRWKEALVTIIQDGAHAGEFTAPDPRGAAWRITAFLDGLAVQALVHGGVQNRERMQEWARRHVAHELGLADDAR
ncbi:TetR/AcrR family transcriptional regulator [Amycolatopsis sp. DSM 110486]|uniref:TetR/AcrR family transcriptional regulator n=1 Tax=Amycolatopsis sp. DSM 110486 TaxID=2865832 RepID=UPI001C69FF1E|nr:TetR/AcrR family transcriptional regulator [Amycolatopsis sp. DSM 110486]QYN22095.1 TetR family transcriptional regulator [Amycolatopsis sp. DSM 110486]